MWARRRIDIGWGDLAFALVRCCWAGRSRRDLIEARWAGDTPTLACLSVRTGFDLLLGALELPRGSEVLMSAINVPAMFRLVEEHGLIPVPLDIDSDTLAPSAEQVRRVVTSRTRAIVIAHLFGTRVDLEAIAALARERDILLVEDHAQAFVGVPEELPATADVALWSFGPIKTTSALGGGVVAIRDAALAARMEALEIGYPVQPRSRFALRVLKYAAMKAVSARWPFGLIVRALSWAGVDHAVWLAARVRSFDDAGLLPALRRRPSAPLLALLARRLRRFDASRATRQRRRGLALESRIAGRVRVVGTKTAWRGFDLFAVLTADALKLEAALRARGFDAGTRGNLAVLGPREGTPGARRLFEHAVFVPLYDAMPDGEVHRLGDVLGQTGTVAT